MSIRLFFIISLFYLSCVDKPHQGPDASVYPSYGPGDNSRSWNVHDVRIHVLNLSETGNQPLDETSKKRFEAISKHLSEAQVPFERFPGVYAKTYLEKVDLSSYNVINFGPVENSWSYQYSDHITSGRYLKAGEIGHYVSFFMMFKEIAKEDQPWLIFEDNARLINPQSFMDDFKELMEQAPPDWKIINLHRCSNMEEKYNAKDSGKFISIPHSSYVKNKAQIFNPDFAKRMVPVMMPVHGLPTDDWLGLQKDKNPTFYCVNPPLVTETAEFGSVINTIEPRP